MKDTVRLQPFLRSSADNFDWAGRPHIQTLAITGPFNATGAGDTPSRARDLRRAGPTAHAHERACATQILGALARRAYRQPVTDAELAADAGVLRRRAAREGTSKPASSAALQRILASPRFVFRVERDPAQARSRCSVYRISDLELASRLSFFLWSSIPDETLLRAGERRASCSSRRCSSSRCGACSRIREPTRWSSNFAGQWLQLRNVRSVQPNSDEFPDFDDNLRQAFRRETELLFESIIREDRNVLDLLRADYTFVNERLARHYGIPNIYGSRFRRVPVTDEARRGLLGQGSDARGDVARRAHVAGAARQVGAREHPRPAGAAAARRRAAAQGQQGGREAEDDARADGRASRRARCARAATR